MQQFFKNLSGKLSESSEATKDTPIGTRHISIQTIHTKGLKTVVNSQPKIIQFDNPVHNSASENFSHRILKPYHTRLLEYNKIKARVFNETLSVPSIYKTSKRYTTELCRFCKFVLNNRRLFSLAFLPDGCRNDI